MIDKETRIEYLEKSIKIFEEQLEWLIKNKSTNKGWFGDLKYIIRKIDLYQNSLERTRNVS